jgi:hypothetical protein
MIIISVKLKGDETLVEVFRAKGSMKDQNDVKKAKSEAFSYLAHGFSINDDENGTIDIYPKELIERVHLKEGPR